MTTINYFNRLLIIGSILIHSTKTILPCGALVIPNVKLSTKRTTFRIPVVSYINNSIKEKKESRYFSASNDEQMNEDALENSPLQWMKRGEPDNNGLLTNEQQQQIAMEEEQEAAGSVDIPKSGVSISDQMVDMQSNEEFVSSVISLEDESPGVAMIDTYIKDSIGKEPIRYLVPLSPLSTATSERIEYAMVDVPPFSENLVKEIKAFMSPKKQQLNNEENHEEAPNSNSNGFLSTILITCQDGLHFEGSSSVYVTRNSELEAWKKSFPELKNIVMYRLDIPKEARGMMTQVLDGYGPWALEQNNVEKGKNGDGGSFSKFIETGRPLKRMKWNDAVQERLLKKKELPPDSQIIPQDDDDALYTPTAIRAREENKKILALYTPGHSFACITYIFPEVKVCCSGFAIPIEDTGLNTNGEGLNRPTLDYKGYVTTNQAGISRQLNSASHIINNYCDRFETVLPSRGQPTFLSGADNDDDAEARILQRKKILNEIVNDFAELGNVYEQLGII